MTSTSDIMSQLAGVVGKPDNDMPIPFWLATSLPNVNLALSGDPDRALPGGRIVTIAGPESCGKTALATELMAESQRLGGIEFYEDFEHSFLFEHAQSIGLNTDEGFFYKKPNIAEEGFSETYKIMETVRCLQTGLPAPPAEEAPETQAKRRMALRAHLKKKDLTKLPPLVGVFDSIASMIPASQDIDFKHQNMKTKNMDHAAMLSLELKRLARDAENMGALIIMLNQLRTNPGVMFGDNSTEPGGNAPRFYASVMIRLRRVGKVHAKWDDKSTPVVGDLVELFTRKNKLHSPYRKTQYIFRHTDPVGLDLPGTMVYLGKEAGVLGPKSGVTAIIGDEKFNINDLISRCRTDAALCKRLTDHVMLSTESVSTVADFKEEEDEKGVIRIAPAAA